MRLTLVTRFDPTHGYDSLPPHLERLGAAAFMRKLPQVSHSTPRLVCRPLISIQPHEILLVVWSV